MSALANRSLCSRVGHRFGVRRRRRGTDTIEGDAPLSVDPRERNEHILRAANEAIQQTRSSRRNQLLTFLCECSTAECDVDVELTLDEYTMIRGHSDRFAVALGHEDDAIERVLDEFDRYTVVEKRQAA